MPGGIDMPPSDNLHDSPALPAIDEFCPPRDKEVIVNDLEAGTYGGIRWLADRAQRHTETPLSRAECKEVIEYRLRKDYLD